jgi:hypothetical protein
MHWGRGLVRLWLVSSVLWIIVATVVFTVPNSLVNIIFAWPEAVRYAKTTNPNASFPFEGLPDVADINAHDAAIENLWHFALFGFGGPIAVLVFGIAIWWVVQGFKPKLPKIRT